MSSQHPPPPPPPPAKLPTAAPTTIDDLDEDLLREVLVRLPSLASLVRAALTCSTFLHVVRSSPAFRRRFQALHRSPFLGLYTERRNADIPSFAAHNRLSRDLAAVVRGSDFSLAGLPDPDCVGGNQGVDDDSEDCRDDDDQDGNDEEEEEEEEEEEGEEEWEEEEEEEEEEAREEEVEETFPVWEIERCCDGYVVLFNRRAELLAAYNPIIRALHLFPLPPDVIPDSFYFEFHIIFSEEDPDKLRVVCFSYGLSISYNFDFDSSRPRVAVISPDSTKWQIFPMTANMGTTGKMVNGSVYWTHPKKPYMTVFNTATLQFSQMELAPLLQYRDGDFVVGNTKDGRLCIVSPDIWGDASLDVYFWRREDEDEDDGVKYWILSQTIPLKTIRRVTKCSKDSYVIVRVRDVIDGIVYLHTDYEGETDAPQLCLSFCLETAKLEKISEDYHRPVYPYVMAWPPSLVRDKGLCSKDQALSTGSSEGSDVKTGGGPTKPASVAKA